MARPPESGSNSDGGGFVRQQIGEILGTVRAIEQRQVERSEDARRQEERVNEEIRTIKHEQRNHEQVIQGHLELLRRQFDELKSINAQATTLTDSKLRELQRDVQEARDEVQALPISELIDLRRRIGTLAVVLSSFAAVLSAIIVTAWKALGDSLLHKLFSSG
jgi:DNA mismatch repair ATPase MutS